MSKDNTLYILSVYLRSEEDKRYLPPNNTEFKRAINESLIQLKRKRNNTRIRKSLSVMNGYKIGSYCPDLYEAIKFVYEHLEKIKWI